jgi:hypothetical protein
MRQVATLRQSVDHTHFGILQTSTILTTTTTTLLQILFKSNPPKLNQKFQTFFLSAILSNTLWASHRYMPMLDFGGGPSPT